MRVCVLHILLKNYFEDPSGNSIPWQRPSGENYHSNVIKTCFPPKLKSADNVYDRELKVNYVKCQKPYTHVSTVRFLSPLNTQSIFASHSVCTTVAWGTTRWLWKFVDEVGSTVSYRNIFWVFATCRAITKADRLFNFTIFHCRMSTNQPAWPVCTTSKCWHTCCWHFCSCSSHKTIPSLTELLVTHRLVLVCYETTLSACITQALMIITWVGWKRLNIILKNVEESKVNIFLDIF